MEYITILMSGLALLAAMVSLVLVIREKKRNQKRNAATLDYLDSSCDKLFDQLNDMFTKYKISLENRIEPMAYDIKQLKDGIVPDYKEALAAKNSVDEFNRGLSAILNFDPMEAARKAREDQKYGGEVE
jgi:hypothetical protein